MGIKRRYQMWMIRRRVTNAIRMLNALDKSFRKACYTRQVLKNFWSKVVHIPSLTVNVQREIVGAQRVNIFSLMSIRRWMISRKVADAVRMCRLLDNALVRAGYDRSGRRHFWRKVAARPAMLIETFDSIQKGWA